MSFSSGRAACLCGPGTDLQGVAPVDGSCSSSGKTSPGKKKDYGPPPPGSCVGDPCNAGTGNEYQTETDYRDPAGRLRFTRAYNSLDTVDHGLGYGWVSNFGQHLTLDSGLLTVYKADGSAEVFTKSDGAWQGDADTKLAVTQDASGYTVHRQDGALERYDFVGRLISETDPAGRVTTFDYDAGGHLMTVTGPFGHTLSFTYGGSDRLASLTDPAGATTRYTYDDAGNLAAVTYPDGTARQYSYADTAYPHALTGIALVDAAGDITPIRYFAYDTTGKVATNSLAGGRRRFDLTYDSDTKTTVTNAAGRVDVLTFESQLGRKLLTSRTVQDDGQGLTQHYDARNNLISHTDADGHTTTYTYDDHNRLTAKTEAAGTASARTIRYQYADDGLALPIEIDRPSVCAGAIQRTRIDYDAHHLPSSVAASGYTPECDPLSRTVTLAYNATGRLTRIDGPRSDVADVTTFTYHDCRDGGACGRLQSLTDALGHTTTFDRYDAAGRLLQSTGPNGLVTSYAYDPRGRLISIDQHPPEGSSRTTTFAYTPDSRLAKVAFPDGRTLVYTYDAARNFTRVTDRLGNHVDYAYDSRGNRTTTRTYDPDGTLVTQVERVFDLRNHLASVNTGGSLTRTMVDAVGNLLQSTDPNDNPPTIHDYDPLRRLTRTIDALGGLTTYAYGPNDHLTRVQTPNGSTTAYRVDDFGDRLEEDSPDRGTTIYTYDPAGNLISRTDARGVTASYAYDALGRLTAIHYDNPPETNDHGRRFGPPPDPDVTLIYDSADGCTDGIGRLCRVEDASGTTTYAYDPWGNVVTETHQDGTGRRGQRHTTTVHYRYDAGNRLVAVTYPDGREAHYTRDALGHIESLTATVDGYSQTLVHDRHYRADGHLTSQTFGNGLADQRTYTAQGWLATWTLTDQSDRVYTYDANGNLTDLQDTQGRRGETWTFGYQYDALNRLTDEQTDAHHTAYIYDANGNRLSQLLSDGTLEAYGYAPASNRLTHVRDRSITLDAEGNTTGDGHHQYRYDAAGRLETVLRHGHPIARYTYDYRGRRTIKQTARGTTRYVYGPRGRLLNVSGAEVRGSERDYLWTDAAPIARIDHRPAHGGLFGLLTGHPTGHATGRNRLIYLHTDGQGTPRLATDARQRTVWRWRGDAFGAHAAHRHSRNEHGHDSQGRQNPRVQVNLRYPGQYFDVETGLFYNYYRFYDPSAGRYTTSDPIGLEAGLNAYAYAEDNPVNTIDPKGNEAVSFLVCEAVNGGMTAYSANQTYRQLIESTELIRDQLIRVNREISQCPAEDTRRLGGLLRTRADLARALAEAIAENTPMPLGDLGPGMIGAGACGILLAVPAP